MDMSGRSFVDHWQWAADKGLMNKNTAGALRAACTQVLSVIDNWESVDIRKLNVDDALARFQNLKKKEFKPRTLDAYKRRFRAAIDSYLAYLDDPGSWRTPGQERAQRTRRRSEPDRSGEGPTMAQGAPPAATSSLVDYPFPLRPGLTARLNLPRDLKASEVKRLTAFMTTLAVDFEPSGADQ